MRERLKRLEQKISSMEPKDRLPVLILDMLTDGDTDDGVNIVVEDSKRVAYYTGYINGKRYWATNISDRLYESEEEVEQVVDEFLKKNFSEFEKQAEKVYYLIPTYHLEEWEHYDEWKDKLQKK